MNDGDHFGLVGQKSLSMKIPDNISYPVYNIPNHLYISNPACNIPEQVNNIHGPISDHMYNIPYPVRTIPDSV